MEKSDTILHELNSLVANIRSMLFASKHAFQNFNQAGQDATTHVTTLLDHLEQEKLEQKVLINELVEEAEQSNVALLEFNTDILDFALQDMKAAYERAVDIQVRLAVAKEQERFLQKNYDELEARLIELHQEKDRNEKIIQQLEAIIEQFTRMIEIEDKIQGLVHSQNFGVKIITAQEEERRRVAREIHDGPAQAMANVIFLAEVCEKLIEIDTARAKRELYELRQQVLGCLTETRKIIFDLRPMVLDDLGLIPTVKRIADILQERAGVKTTVKLSGMHSQPLDSRIEVSLFRIIQESLNNIEKHAGASEAEIVMDFQTDCVTATVRDDGKGFETRRNSRDSETFGLLGMRERVSLLHGELNIHSQTGRGTEINVRIPLETVVGEEKRLA